MRQTSISSTDAQGESIDRESSKTSQDLLNHKTHSSEIKGMDRQQNFLAKHFTVFNLVVFQATWWGIVLSSSAGMAWVTPALALTALTAHFGILSRTGETSLRSEILFVLSCAWVGYSADSLVSFFGLIQYEGNTLFGLAPLWIASLWLVFPITLRHSLKWLFRSQKIMIPVAFLSGPLTYLVGEKFDLLQYPEPRLINMALHGLVWVFLVQVFRRSAIR